MPSITYDDLEAALTWVSGSMQSDNAAYISKVTGRIFYASTSYDSDPELPSDCENEALYWSVPHKNELNLGRALAFRFVDERMPDQRDRVQDLFRKSGAYERYKDLLIRAYMLDEWFVYERQAIERTLTEWAKEQGIAIVPM